MIPSRLACSLLLLAATVASQQQFRAAYERAERLRESGRSTADDLRAAYGTACDEFLRMPHELQADPNWLPAGAFCAQLAERHELAAELFEASFVAGNEDDFTAENLLRSLRAAGRDVELLKWARKLEARFTGSVQRVLVDERALFAARAWSIGGRWLETGETEAGLWVFRYLVEASPNDATALANHALALRQVGREAAAEKRYREAIAAGEDGRIWNDLGLLLKGAGRIDDAVTAFLRSRELEQGDPIGPATTNLALLQLQHDRRVLDAPDRQLAVALRARPDASLARRAILDLLTGQRAFRSGTPDSVGEMR